MLVPVLMMMMLCHPAYILPSLIDVFFPNWTKTDGYKTPRISEVRKKVELANHLLPIYRLVTELGYLLHLFTWRIFSI